MEKIERERKKQKPLREIAREAIKNENENLKKLSIYASLPRVQYIHTLFQLEKVIIIIIAFFCVT